MKNKCKFQRLIKSSKNEDEWIKPDIYLFLYIKLTIFYYLKV